MKAPTPSARDTRSGKASPETLARNARPLNEVLEAMKVATPRASDAGKGGRGDLISQMRGHNSRHAGMRVPTPTAQSYGSNQGGAAGRTGEVRPSLNRVLSPTAKGNLTAPSMLEKWAGARTLAAWMSRSGMSGPTGLMTVYRWLMGFQIGSETGRHDDG